MDQLVCRIEDQKIPRRAAAAVWFVAVPCNAQRLRTRHPSTRTPHRAYDLPENHPRHYYAALIGVAKPRIERVYLRPDGLGFINARRVGFELRFSRMRP